MYRLLRSLLFLLPAEIAHQTVCSLLRIPGISRGIGYFSRLNDPGLAREVFGIRFPNPVGLAAGFDKDARLIKPMADLGFGFIEIGTLTPLPQAGNPRPRIFRLPKDEALINRMGFNNQGVEAAIERLKHKPEGVIIGGNIGKNRVTPNLQAARDYERCFEALYPYVDYFTVNVSSPNTPNLRELQEKKPLQRLLQQLQARNRSKPAPKPILLKIAPDLNEHQLNDIIEIVQAVELAGVIAVNTTISREGLTAPSHKIDRIGAGGLSGPPLRDRSTEIIRYLHQQSGGAFPIIGVGGIDAPESALEKLAAGASLIQIYSGFVYHGPALIKRINRAILASEADKS